MDPLGDGVDLRTFAKFLKDKIEKTKDMENLVSYARLMDIDKDGIICQNDV